MEQNKAGERARRRMRRGYEKLAYGKITDAVRLLFAEDPGAEEIGKMDLANVAEIKRPRGGGMEIKFFDRLKALQCLEAMDGEAGAPLPLYRTLQECARSFREDGDGV